MPQQDDIDRVVDSVFRNGLHFLDSSVEVLKADPVVSTVHFALGLELTLKAILMKEHWALVATNPHAANWATLTDGTSTTIGGNALLKALVQLVTPVLRKEREAFQNVFDHRNRIAHFRPPDDSRAMVAEQCTAWYHLHRLLTEHWSRQTEGFEIAIKDLNEKMLGHHQFLQSKFEQIGPRLQGPKSAGRLVTCPSCRFEAVVVAEESDLSDGECRVCQLLPVCGQCDCGVWFPLEELPRDCSCGETVCPRAIADRVSPEPVYATKHDLGAERDAYWCGDCLDVYNGPTVIPWKDGCRCASCGIESDCRIELCECCNEAWVGLMLEHSFYLGCELCDGHQPD